MNKRVIKLGKLVLSSLARLPAVPAVAYRIHANSRNKGAYGYYRNLFIQNGLNDRYNTQTRLEIVRRFEEIQWKVRHASTPTDGLVLAEGLLSMDAEGDIIECGCYAGASSAKLSIIASLLGKKLLVFDSFEGLPQGGERLVHTRRTVQEITRKWPAGAYGAGLDVVRRNIETFGEISVCSFIQGWFNQTLNSENLSATIAAAFVDVDLHSSAQECLTAIWPRLARGGIFFSHDVAFITVLQHLCDEELWRNTLKSFPPIFFGAGFGVCDLSPHLGYMVKGADVSAEYLKQLTLNK